MLFTLRANRRLSLPANCPRAHRAELSDSWRRLKHKTTRQPDTTHTSNILYTDYHVTPLVSASGRTTSHLNGNAQTHWQLARYVALSPGGSGICSTQEVLLFITSTQQMFALIILDSDSERAHSSAEHSPHLCWFNISTRQEGCTPHIVDIIARGFYSVGLSNLARFPRVHCGSETSSLCTDTDDYPQILQR